MKALYKEYDVPKEQVSICNQKHFYQKFKCVYGWHSVPQLTFSTDSFVITITVSIQHIVY